MKSDYQEIFRYYKDLINFPHADNKDLCKWYQDTCRFHPEDIKLRELTLVERIIKWVIEIKRGKN